MIRDWLRWALLPLAATLLAGVACGPVAKSAEPQELYVLNWEDYFAPDTLSNFEREFGIRVTLETFDGEEAMLAGLQSHPGRYDVAIASGAMVATLRELRLIEGVNPQNIPNLANIEERFRGLPFDPEGQYSVPYLWGTTGLAVNTKYIPRDTNSWGVLWDAAYKGRLAMLNDPQEVLGSAMLLLGYSFNSRDPQHLEAARQKLLEQSPLLAGYLDPASIIEGLASEKLWAAQIYNGDALTAASQNPNVLYIIPRENAALWVDNLVIPFGAPNRKEAEIFINYILRPQVATATVNYLHYATPNGAARAFILPEILDNPSVYPTPETLSRLELYQPLDEETNQRLNRIWADLLNR